ncbi:RcpC/CpaB family pilus assembly protein [Microlunatus antarcticus]|uniref:Flp pilus assembly protein CpaB n=1 Tax=Microlunatus antarcticus TaxID=53388 RepID=A0A7W5JYF6_9ACTN|nr:RcpC/CpaB family pilus assembly protein [Microlunatus antarcticus]MBB3328633.1 Flp pilus assembly protein CpaB [Microlunatus antarcticus]
MRARPAPRPSPHRRSPLRQLRRAASWHRRKLAVLAAVATVLTGLASVAPPAPPTTPVVRTTQALAGGVLLSADDLEVVDLPRDAVPDRTMSDPAELVGRRLAAPVPRRQVLTVTALASVDSSVGVGHVLAPVRLADADVVALLEPGDLVDVIASAADGGATTTVARSVRVVTVPAADPDDQGTATGALVVLDLAEDDAEPLARAAATGNLTVVWP